MFSTATTYPEQEEPCSTSAEEKGVGGWGVGVWSVKGRKAIVGYTYTLLLYLDSGCCSTDPFYFWTISGYFSFSLNEKLVRSVWYGEPTDPEGRLYAVSLNASLCILLVY